MWLESAFVFLMYCKVEDMDTIVEAIIDEWDLHADRC